MSSSEESETFRSPNGSPERAGTLRRSRRIALAGQVDPAETLNVTTRSQLDTVRNALQDTIDANRRATDFAGFSEQPEINPTIEQQPELNPQIEERIDTPSRGGKRKLFAVSPS